MLSSYFNLALAMVIVGSSVVAGKIMIDGMPVFLSSGLRFLVASLIIVPVLFIREGGLPKLSRRSLYIFALQALCGSFLFTVLLLYGITYTGPACAGILTSTTPAFMGILGWLAFKERFSLPTVAGIILSLSGVAVLSAGQNSGPVQGSLFGILLVLGAVFMESLFLIFRKFIVEEVTPLAATAIISFLGLLWFLPFAAYDLLTIDCSTVSIQSMGAVFYYGVVVTVLAYLFWFSGVVNMSASVAGVFTGLMPVSAVLLSAIILDEPMYWFHYCGCSLVLCGIVLISGIHSKIISLMHKSGEY